MGRQRKILCFSTKGVGDFCCCDPPWETTGTLRIMPEWVFDYCLFMVESDVLPITYKIGFWESKWRLKTWLKNNLDLKKKKSHIKEGEWPPGHLGECGPLLNSFTENKRSTFPGIPASQGRLKMPPETRPSNAYPRGHWERRNFRKQCLYILMSWKAHPKVDTGISLLLTDFEHSWPRAR